MPTKIHVHEIPQWLLALPKKSLVSAKDFAVALGVSTTTFKDRSRSGEMDIQPCSKKIVGRSRTGLPASPAHYWKAVVVRNYIRQQIRKQEADKNE